MANLPNEHLDAALKARIAALEDALDAAREHVVFLRNENQSLQTSLDLIVTENVRLSHSLEERDAEALKVRSRIDQLKTLLRSAEGKLSAAVVAKPAESSARRLLGGTITF